MRAVLTRKSFAGLGVTDGDDFLFVLGPAPVLGLHLRSPLVGNQPLPGAGFGKDTLAGVLDVGAGENHLAGVIDIPPQVNQDAADRALADFGCAFDGDLGMAQM